MYKEMCRRFLKIIFIFTILFFTFAQFNVHAAVENEAELLEQVQKYNDDNPESTNYLVTDENVSNIAPNTMLSDFENNIETGIKLYKTSDKEDEVIEGLVKTGMSLEYLQNGRTFDVSVLGDLNGDGILNQIDLTREIRDLVKSENWLLTKDIEILSGDMNKNHSIDEEDRDAMIDYIVFDRFNTVKYREIKKAEVSIKDGKYQEDRYVSDVDVEIKEKDTDADRTVYKIIGSKEEDYKEINKIEDKSIEDDGVYRIIAYTYGKDGNKSKGESVTFIREITVYKIQYKYEGGNLKDGEENPTEYTEKSEQFTVINPEREGYTFEGWREDGLENLNKNVVVNPEMAEDKILIAVWKANTDTKYTVETYLQNVELTGYEKQEPVEVKTGVTDTEVTETALEKIGYTFNSELSTLTGTIQPDGSLVLKLYYDRNTDTKYTVETYIQNVELTEYVKQEPVVEKTGITGATVTEIAEEKTGYTFDSEMSTVTGTIESDGSLVLKLYYDRNADTKYTVETYIQNVELTEYVKQEPDEEKEGITGAEITETAPVKQGYTFNSEMSTLTGTIEPDGSLVLKLYYDRNTDTKYTVETYIQNVELTEYVKQEPVVEKKGITGAIVTEIAEEKMGYTFNSKMSTLTGAIAPDGSLVLKLYYDRNADTKYMVETYIQNIELTEYIKQVPDEEKEGVSGAKITETAPEKTGYTFNSEMSTLTGTIEPDGSLVLKLYYDRNTDTKYTIETYIQNVELTGYEKQEPVLEKSRSYRSNSNRNSSRKNRIYI